MFLVYHHHYRVGGLPESHVSCFSGNRGDMSPKLFQTPFACSSEVLL